VACTNVCWNRVVAFIVAFCGVLLFFFVPETFWDRKPVPKVARKSSGRPSIFRRYSSKHIVPTTTTLTTPAPLGGAPENPVDDTAPTTTGEGEGQLKVVRVGFAPDVVQETGNDAGKVHNDAEPSSSLAKEANPESPDQDAVSPEPKPLAPNAPLAQAGASGDRTVDTDSESQSMSSGRGPIAQAYTVALRGLPAQSFVQQLKPFHGRLNKDKWHKVAIRPLILFSYPAVLWSAVVYACSVGWLIVISESVAVIYREGHPYKFNALQTGLVYISPFVGGVLGTAVAGKVSDVIVKAMARRNGGLYEPEFRLVMAAPIAVTTVLGLMGFGWSAQVGQHYMVPTVFFGIVSFGCCLGSTTSITFCVDSYRQYAGEALVTLNFSKNVFHGLVFSLFVTGWLEEDGSKTVYIWIGIIQLILLLFSIPMYIYGKRARMWTVRKNFMERF